MFVCAGEGTLTFVPERASVLDKSLQYLYRDRITIDTTCEIIYLLFQFVYLWT